AAAFSLNCPTRTADFCSGGTTEAAEDSGIADCGAGSPPKHPRCRSNRLGPPVNTMVARILGGFAMLRSLVLAAVLVGCFASSQSADAQQPAYGRTWGGGNSSIDWNRFYHYPYVY